MPSETLHANTSYQRQIAPCDGVDIPCGWIEHTVGQTPSGLDIIDAVCPHCGYRVARREVVENPAGVRYADVR